jgi:hypothetical protein
VLRYLIFAQLTSVGYPPIVFYVSALIGIILILYRPYWAFSFSVFALSARNFHAAVHTRIGLFGPYVNLNDLLLWIALFAMLRELFLTKRKPWSPKLLSLIFLLIFVGANQSFIKYGFDPRVLRSVWHVLIFPILFLTAANLVTSERRATLFFGALLLGSVAAAFQHIVFFGVASSSTLSGGAPFVRVISYLSNGGVYILTCLLLIEFKPAAIGLKTIFYYVAVIAISLSVILSLTRGLYIFIIVGLVAIPIILHKKFVLTKGFFKFGVAFLIGILVVFYLLPTVNIWKNFVGRIDTLVSKEQRQESYAARERGAQTEFGFWLNSSLILGIGVSLPPRLLSGPEEADIGALYHVALSAYLAHFGIAGLLLYALWLPLATMKRARSLYYKVGSNHIKILSILAIVCALMDIVELGGSYHQLWATSHAAGLIYGMFWGVYHSFSGSAMGFARREDVPAIRER